jgi:CubicO group peptidase (beta-lactamase class C family)
MTEPESAASLLTLNTGGYLAPGGWDSPAALMSVMPSVGGVGNARSLCAMYRAIVHDRQVGRFTIDDGALAAMTTSQSRLSRDCVLHAPAHWSLGFQKGGCSPADVEPPQRVALGPDAFGHTGMGGSISFADPSCGLAFSYTMNQMALDMGLGPTGEALVDATYRALGYQQPARRDLWFRPTAT